MTQREKFVFRGVEEVCGKSISIRSGFCLVNVAPFYLFNPLPDDKILDWSKLKAFADDKLNLAEKLKFILGSVENIVGKGENAGDQHFLLFPQC